MAERSKAPDSSLSFRVDHHTEHSGLARGGGSNPPLVTYLFFFCCDGVDMGGLGRDGYGGGGRGTFSWVWWGFWFGCERSLRVGLEEEVRYHNPDA
jgi:hypothetical protein